MGSDLNDVAPPRVVKGPDCYMASLWADLSPKSLAMLRSWMRDPRWTSRAISDQIRTQLGVDVRENVIQRHRRRNCTKCDAYGRDWFDG